eukprot:GHVS01066377.1.p1 GENE.GHVS01066377.1~~GHVS01066377.1.p1  ORF type:complete len:292 (-),score=14.28 GHVS01066377.1:1075-1950(-)
MPMLDTRCATSGWMLSVLWQWVCVGVADVATDCSSVVDSVWSCRGRLFAHFLSSSCLAVAPSQGPKLPLCPVRLFRVVLRPLLTSVGSLAALPPLASYLFDPKSGCGKHFPRRVDGWRVIRAVVLLATLLMPYQALGHALVAQSAEDSLAASPATSVGLTARLALKSNSSQVRNLMIRGQCVGKLLMTALFTGICFLFGMNAYLAALVSEVVTVVKHSDAVLWKADRVKPLLWYSSVIVLASFLSVIILTGMLLVTTRRRYSVFPADHLEDGATGGLLSEQSDDVEHGEGN